MVVSFRSLLSTELAPAGVDTELLEQISEPFFLTTEKGLLVSANSLGCDWLQQHHCQNVVVLNFFEQFLPLNCLDTPDQISSFGSDSPILLQIPESGETIQVVCLLHTRQFALKLIDPTNGINNLTSAHNSELKDLVEERDSAHRSLLASYYHLQEIDHKRTLFLGSAAHELKTPLAVMRGYYDLLLSGGLGPLSEKQRVVLQDSRANCERLIQLVLMFLNYSALEAGKLELHNRINRIEDCLDDLINKWKVPFQEKQILFLSNFDEEIPEFAFDYQKVQQCTSTLLDNALKFTDPGGSVIVSSRPYFWERRIADCTWSDDLGQRA